MYEDNIGSDHWPVICEIKNVVKKQHIGEKKKDIEECMAAIRERNKVF